MEHPSGIPDKIVKKVVARRGRLHAFESIEGARTALVVIDLDVATVEADDQCKRLIPIVNEMARAVRDHGGVVAWVLSRMTAMPRHFAAILGADSRPARYRHGADCRDRDQHLLRVVGS